MRRFTSRIAAFAAVPAAEQTRQLHFPISPPPIEIDYLDSDPLEFAVRTEARRWGFDDLQYMRELAFVRIKNNPSIGDFRNMTPEERRDLFWGSDRQDFFRYITLKLTGHPEHLYHRGCFETVFSFYSATRARQTKGGGLRRARDGLNYTSSIA